jgi:acyl-CoA synthetase (AMP-forming)/AMP-acid ligase II
MSFSQAFAVPDPKVGEEICVFLKLRDGALLTEDDIRNYSTDKVSLIQLLGVG